MWSFALGWIGFHLAWYLPFGRALVKAMYNQRAPEFLNKVIKDRESLPLEHFIDKANGIFYGELLFFPLCMLLFYTFLYKAFKRLIADSKLPQFNRLENNSEQTKNYGWLIATGIYILITLFYFRNVWPGFDTHIIGPAEDNLKYLWSIWYGWQMLINPELSLTFTTKMFYPEGVSLLYNDWSFYNLILSFPLRQLFSPVSVYNLLILHTFPLAGLGTFLLVRHLTNRSLVAFAAGLIFAFNPSHLAHSLHHMNITSIQFLPFFLLFFIRTLESSSRKHLLLAALFFLLLAICDWTWMIFAVAIMFYFYVISAIKKDQVFNKDLLKKIAVIVGSTILVLSPWLIQMILEGIHYAIDTGGGHRSFVVDLVALIMPYYLHLLASFNPIAELCNLYTGNLWESTAYLGLINIILLIYAIKRLPQQTAIWSGAILFVGVLSMGTSMHFAGFNLPLLLPFAIIKYLPILEHIRVPARFITLIYLFFAIIVGYSLTDLARRYSSTIKARLLIAGVCLVIFIDFLPRDIATSEVSLPNCYQAIITDNKENEVSILDLPVGRVQSQRYLMYQTKHGLPIMQGFVPRRPTQSLIDRLDIEDLRYQKVQLRQAGVKYIVWHKTIEDASAVEINRYREQYRSIYDDSLNLVLTVY